MSAPSSQLLPSRATSSLSLPLRLLRSPAAFRDRLAARALSGAELAALALFVCAACAVYGVALAGCRDALLTLYVAVKLPLLFLSATLLVAAFNAVVAALLGTGLGVRDVLALVFSAMAFAGWILLALAPVAFFFSAALMPADGPPDVLRRAHNTILLAHIAALGAAGLAGNAALFAGLRRLVRPGGPVAAVAAIWIASYAFVGTQLGWMMRPFVGSPFYPTVFLREDALDRNFYEFVFGDVIPYLSSSRNLP